MTEIKQSPYSRHDILLSTHVTRHYHIRLFLCLSLRAQDDQVIKVLRPNEFPKEHLERHGHTSHVGRVVRHVSELRLLDFGQQVALVDLDVEGVLGDGLRATLQFWIYGRRMLACGQQKYGSNRGRGDLRV